MFLQAYQIGVRDGYISKNIRIPRLREAYDRGHYPYVMERIVGQTLMVKALRQIYAKQLGTVSESFLDSMTDYVFHTFLREQLRVDVTLLKMPTSKYLICRLYGEQRWQEVEAATNFLRVSGLQHDDILENSSNFMIDNCGNIVIIDFGIVTVN
jgi:hypothetical protein